MNKEDIEIGMKVVPHQKTKFSSLKHSQCWKRALDKKQDYLFVIEWNEKNQAYLLDDFNHNYQKGEYFNSEDFERFIENKELNEKMIEEETKKYFGSRFDEEYSYDLVPHQEFQKLKDLIYKCIDQYRK